jgi:hypothetical protein
VAAGGPSAPLIGRRDQLPEMQAALTATAEGTGRILLFIGEAGIGKTRLADEALAQAAQAGMATLRGRAEELDARRPFGAVAACLGITPTVEDQPRRAIARLLFGDLSDRAETLMAAGGHETEFRLVEAMVVLVEELCAKGPVALAIDRPLDAARVPPPGPVRGPPADPPLTASRHRSRAPGLTVGTWRSSESRYIFEWSGRELTYHWSAAWTSLTGSARRWPRPPPATGG